MDKHLYYTTIIEKFYTILHKLSLCYIGLSCSDNCMYLSLHTLSLFYKEALLIFAGVHNSHPSYNYSISDHALEEITYPGNCCPGNPPELSI